MSAPFLPSLIPGMSPTQSPDAASGPSSTPPPAEQASQLLAYGLPLHGKVLARLNARLNLSHRKISQRYPDWDRVDEKMRMFLDLSRGARKGDKTTDVTKREMPFGRSVVVPASYAIKEVRTTQMLSLFAYRNPMIQLEGRGPEDVKPAKLLETMLAYDQQQTNVIINLYSMLQDAEKYGVGICYDVFDEEPGYFRPADRPTGNPIIDGAKAALKRIGILPKQSPREWGIVREFNRWSAVDPYNWWPDPRTPVGDVQNGEFVGHRIYRGFMYLLERGGANGQFFNIEKVKEAGATSTRITGGGDSGNRELQRTRFAADDFSLKDSADEKDKGFYALDHLQVKLVPKDWELGGGLDPEIWWFTVADNNIIIRAHPSTYDHGKFTYSTGEVNPDPHSLFNPGMTENLDGLQRFMDWLLNSHLANVMRSVNDAIVYAPSLLEEGDLLNPGAARHIRLSKLGERMLVEGRITIPATWSQLAIQDVTGSHLKTLEVLFDMAQRMGAANDPAMGQPTETKRTLGEIQSMIAAASQRVSVTARLFDAQCIAPLVARAIANRQQFTSLDQYFRVAGDIAKETGGADRLMIGARDIQGDFDYLAHDGVIPADPARQAETWVQILQAIGQYPQLAAPGPDGKQLDVREIFNETVRAAGIKNIERFYVSVMPDPSVEAGVQAGNLIPADQAPPSGPIPGAGIQTPMVAVPPGYTSGGGPPSQTTPQ